MIRPVKTLVYGLTGQGQALETGLAGIDGAVVAVAGPDAPACAVDPVSASRIVTALPPLAARLALLPPGIALPAGFTGAVTGPADPRPSGALVRVVRAEGPGITPSDLPPDAEGLWIASHRFDFAALERLSHRVKLIVEVADGAAGIEVVVRLARPYAVLLGEGVWYRPGIVDMDQLEEALGVVARLNKAAYS